MGNYIVSARKYRPSTFKSVIGQEALTTTLKNAIATQKLAHSYLFCGPRGVGKTTCARIFAKTINCLSPTEDHEACNQCESCIAFNEQRSYNIHELDAASNNSVDDIRQLIDQVRIPPQIGRYKVYIIDEVHMLSASAFNAFLKTLEEPPQHAIFILATTEKHKILPTILSRCQIYDFNRIGVEDIAGHLADVALQENITAELEALNIIALKADGGMRDALSIFDQIVSFTNGNITYKSVIKNLNVLDYEYYFRLTDNLLQNDVKSALLLFDSILKKGFDGNHFITGLASHFRDLLVSRDAVTLPLLEVGANIRQRYLEQAQTCPESFLYQAIKLCNDCDLNYRVSKNKRLLVELTLMQLSQLTVKKNEFNGQPAVPKTAAETVRPIAQPANASARPPVGTMPTVAGQMTKRPQESKPQQNTQPIGMPQAAVRTPSPGANSEGNKVHKMSLSNIGISIKQAQQKQPEEKRPVPQESNMPQTTQDVEFNEQDLRHYWQEYAKQLPQEQTAFAKRMQGIQPILRPGSEIFQIAVDNEIAAKDFARQAAEIQNFLRAQLRNSKVQMEIQQTEQDEKTSSMGRMEKFQVMAQKNQALIALKNEFGLELY